MLYDRFLSNKSDFCNPLCKALNSGSLDSVRQALTANKKNLNNECLCGYLPLHFAIQRLRSFGNNQDVIKLMVEAGADVNIKMPDGNTPLHMVFRMTSCEEVQELLIESGADLNIKNKQGDTAAHIGVRNCSLEIAKSMIVAGADVNSKTLDNRTLLHFAAMGRNNPVIEYLVSRGIDVNVKDDFGLTPLHCLGQTSGPFKENGPRRAPECDFNSYGGGSGLSKLPTTELLLKSGADANALNIKNETPLQVFAKNSSDHIMELLVNNTKKSSSDQEKVELVRETPESVKQDEKIEEKDRDAIIDLIRKIKAEIAASRKKQSENLETVPETDRWAKLEEKMKDLLLTVV